MEVFLTARGLFEVSGYKPKKLQLLAQVCIDFCKCGSPQCHHSHSHTVHNSPTPSSQHNTPNPLKPYMFALVLDLPAGLTFTTGISEKGLIFLVVYVGLALVIKHLQHHCWNTCSASADPQ